VNQGTSRLVYATLWKIPVYVRVIVNFTLAYEYREYVENIIQWLSEDVTIYVNLGMVI
jgi:hypothetical protein